MKIRRKNFKVYLQKKKFLREISVLAPIFFSVNKSDFEK